MSDTAETTPETTTAHVAHATKGEAEHIAHPHPDKAHPKDSLYITVALILGVLTAIEVGMSYWKIDYFTNITLLLLALLKFSLVAMFFMHLRFDNPVLRRLFLTGIIVALSVYFIVMLTFGLFIS